MKLETYITSDTLAAKTAGWMEAIAPWNHRERRYRTETTALIVVDMQRFFLEPQYPLACENSRVVVPRIKKLIAAFREAGRPVIFVAQMHKAVDIDRGVQLSTWWPVPPLEGTIEVEMHPELAPLPTEKVIPKRRYGGFHATDLDLTLRVMGITDVVVSGVLTNVCVEHTARDAFMNDYRVFIPSDSTASLNEEMHVAALTTMAGWYAKIVTTDALCHAMADPAGANGELLA